MLEEANDTSICNAFELKSGVRLEGKSTLINKRSGFGYIANGINQRQNEVLIALRGTEFSYLFDVWTDGNIGVQSLALYLRLPARRQHRIH